MTLSTLEQWLCEATYPSSRALYDPVPWLIIYVRVKTLCRGDSS